MYYYQIYPTTPHPCASATSPLDELACAHWAIPLWCWRGASYTSRVTAEAAESI